MTTRARWLGWALVFSIGGCATAPPGATPDDRYAPARMKNGPSIYETGRIAVVPPSSSGLRIDEGTIDRPPPASPVRAPAGIRSRRLSSRHAHPRSTAAPDR